MLASAGPSGGTGAAYAAELHAKGLYEDAEHHWLKAEALRRQVDAMRGVA